MEAMSDQHDPWLDNTGLDSLLSMSPSFTLGSSAGLSTPPEEPGTFVQNLASQNQVLACLRWLGEFQIASIVPLRGSISTAEVAELAGVPLVQLSRIIRMTATAGFLSEPQPDQLMHTPLSARFVSDLSFFDAVMFLAENAAPAALQMTTATERQGRCESSNDSAYSVAFNTKRPFHSVCQAEPRLQRRFNAYLRHTSETSNTFIELLSRLNWRSLGKACVVDVRHPSFTTSSNANLRVQQGNARSTDVASALCQWNSSLQVIIQTDGIDQLPNQDGRFSMQTRAPAATQTVKDATVYVLRLRDVSTIRDQLAAELQAHLHVLRDNGSATLIVEVPFVPEPGSVDPNVEAAARLWDLSRSQLMNEGDQSIEDLEKTINGVGDGSGRLVVVNKLRARTSATLAVGVRYESCLNGLYSSASLLV